ncbi:MAG: glycosyltransferase [Ilumatobacteraceae bacterium]
MRTAQRSRFEHVERLSDERGLFERASGLIRREEHGYSTDDNARLLIVTARELDSGPPRHLGRLALRFVLDAQDLDGRCHNRMNSAGCWTDVVSTDDSWGHSVWGLGVMAANHPAPPVRRAALRGFNKAIGRRSRHSRSMAFAALGAADVLVSDRDHQAALALLADTLLVVGPVPAGAWTWPEPRLTYANATLAEAVIAAGHALDRSSDLDRGLAMLDWLLELEMTAGHLSVVGLAGRGPDDIEPMYDQQPIEVAAMADACWRAALVTGDRTWLRGVAAAARWFGGANDTGLPMFDDSSGGGFDGLQADSVNLNQGAESTLAFISTMQRARSLVFAP